MAEHQGEQPDDAGEPGLVGERDDKAVEVDLGLLARRCLEAHLKGREGNGAYLAHGAFDRRVTTGIAALAQLTPEPHGGQVRKGCKTLPQKRQECRYALLAWFTRAVGRWLQAPGDVFADGLAIQSGLPSDGRDLQALPVEFQDHHEFPKSDHRAAPSAKGNSIGEDGAAGPSRARPRKPGITKTGENSRPTIGEYSTPAHRLLSHRDRQPERLAGSGEP